MERIYLDHNATTPLDPRVLEVMLPVLRDGFGNPSSLHWYGQGARAAIDAAREQVARLIGATPQEIVFTGSGTEADNLALRGVLGMARQPRKALVTNAIEHHAVVNTAKAVAEEGGPVTTIPACEDGRVDLEALEEAIDERTALVALMLANNETGVVQPVKEVAALAHHLGALVHCDAVQAAGKIPVDVRALDVDTLALSAHKFYGPKGVGVLYVRRGTRLKPWLRGGSQEKNRRAGTENVAGIVGMGRAAELAQSELSEEVRRIEGLRHRLEVLLLAIPGTVCNGTGPRVPNTTNVSFDGIEAESLVLALDLMGVAVSTGAACAAGAVAPSHVLRGMGLPLPRVQASLRFSLGRSTTAADIHRAAAAVADAVERQRRSMAARPAR